jgi:hypothetical protein
MTQPTRTPYAHKIRYGITGAPILTDDEMDGSHAPDVGVAPVLIELVYSAALTDRPASVAASVTGVWTRFGKREQPERTVTVHFKNGPAGWPDWLAEEARLHDPEPAAVSAAVAPPTDTTHGLSVQHADALWDAVAIPGPHTPTYPEQHERVCRAVRDILDELTPARDDAVAQTALRDRIADKLTAAAYECDGKCGLSERECYDAHPITFSAMAGGTAHVDGSVTAIADAVLAELPSAADWDALVREADRLRRDGKALHARAEELDTQLTALRQQVTEPTDRAAVYREAVDDLATAFGDPMVKYIGALGVSHLRRRAREIEAGQRRMADETATETPDAPHPPHDSWLVEWRADGGDWNVAYPTHDHTKALDRLARGRQDAPDWQWRIVRETTTYTVEQPAAGARQDGAES